MKPRILFVDDDPNILGGLRNFFRKERQRWDLLFAGSGESALAQYASGPVDIIVCDMRMPGMDGATLLQLIKRDHPETTRIVLSGQADREGISRAIPVTHQFLSKPCDGDVLKGVLERTSGLRALMTNDAVRKVVGRVEQLPSEPTLYWELVRATSDGMASTAEIAAIVERDPAMTAKVLQLVNSAYFGLAHRVSSIAQAITYLGLDLLKGLTLSTQVFGTLDHATVRGISLADLQRHSLTTARMTTLFGSHAALRESAFTAAMVHDIGEVVLALGLGAEYAEIVTDSTGQPQHVLERERLGVTHAEVGAYLLGLWGLPLPLIETVAYHHEPVTGAVGNAELLAVVHVADAFETCRSGARGGMEPDAAFLASAGVLDRLEAWRSMAQDLCARLEGWDPEAGPEQQRPPC